MFWKYYILHIPDLKLKSFVKFLQVFTMANPFLYSAFTILFHEIRTVTCRRFFKLSGNPWLHCYPLYQKWHAGQQTEHGLSRPPEHSCSFHLSTVFLQIHGSVHPSLHACHKLVTADHSSFKHLNIRVRFLTAFYSYFTECLICFKRKYIHLWNLAFG